MEHRVLYSSAPRPTLDAWYIIKNEQRSLVDFAIIKYLYHNMMHYGYGYAPMMGYGGWGYGGDWFLSPLFGILIAIGIAVLVVSIIRGIRGGSFGTRRALNILKERYAKGEITKHEFEEMKKELSQ